MCVCVCGRVGGWGEGVCMCEGGTEEGREGVCVCVCVCVGREEYYKTRGRAS